MLPDAGQPAVYISYAWGDKYTKEGLERTQVVEGLCTVLENDGWKVLRDTNTLHSGDLISGFMQSLTRADRIILVISAKYLQSPACMVELYGIYQRSVGDKTDFVDRVVPITLSDAKFGNWRDREKIAAHWRAEYTAMDEARENLGGADLNLYKTVRDWHNRVGDILAHVSDVLHPHGFDDIVKDDFAALREMLRRQTDLTKYVPPWGNTPTGLTPPPVRPLRGTSATAPVIAYEPYTSKLPVTDSTLIGRDAELAQLEAALRDGANLVQVVAPGGTGKTALMTNWYKRHVDKVPIYGWSFYKQGTGDSANVSSDDFLNHAVGWFNLRPKDNTADAKAEALVHHLRQHRTLLILDGLEPLQNQATGELNDYACKDLLRELSVQNAGLVLCTSRVPLADLPDVLPLKLDNLTEADGAQYLRQKFGVHGSEEDLREASKAYGNHALALTLLGSYLQDHDRDLSRRFEIDDLPESDTKPGSHARRVMQSYARVFEGKPEGDILRGLGFFDRPAEREALKLVLRGPLQEAALVKLRRARLILSADALAPIDCHPLVREHFGAFTKASDPEGFRAGHSKLFDYYCRVPKKEHPDTLEELTPLFHAVAHGCHAGRHQEACGNVYYGRIQRDDEDYLVAKLGAFGTDLSLLAHFFEVHWSRPVPTLTTVDQTWVTGSAAFALRALGRLADALEPMRAGADSDTQRQDWKNAAISYSNLSELLLTLGRTADAVTTAREGLDYADRSGNTSWRMARRTTLADALHQSGDRAEAARLFAEAESMQKEWQPDYPLLYSLRGYQYCDLLLAQGDHAEAFRRATQTITIAERNNWLLDIGLDHLTLGRAHAPGSPESRHHLEQAVVTLRRAGSIEHLNLALLARATYADLEEVDKIATRSQMRRHLTDYHLAMARRLRSLEHLQKAEDLIQQTGYHRRDEEAAALRAELQS